MVLKFKLLMGCHCHPFHLIWRSLARAALRMLRILQSQVDFFSGEWSPADVVY